jgi:hypothetical protein
MYVHRISGTVTSDHSDCGNTGTGNEDSISDDSSEYEEYEDESDASWHPSDASDNEAQ